METWVSGPGMEADHARMTGAELSAAEIAARAAAGDAAAAATLHRHAGRLARGIASVVNIFDPDVVVLGGGLSRLAHLYEVLPGLIAPHVFADFTAVIVKPPVWGDAGGARGAAWLWE
jgi:fructokinase